MSNNDTREGTAYAARAALGGARVSVRALAQQTGRSHAYWTRRLNGEQPFTTDDLAAVADVTGVPAADLLAA